MCLVGMATQINKSEQTSVGGSVLCMYQIEVAMTNSHCTCVTIFCNGGMYPQFLYGIESFTLVCYTFITFLYLVHSLFAQTSCTRYILIKGAS